jgi:hypothetical protein
MLGLESYKPTDCIGTVSEARLAFAMCRARGVGGIIADDIDVTDILAEAETTLDRFGAVNTPGPTYPRRLAEPIGSLLRANAEVARQFARDVLSALPPGRRTSSDPRLPPDAGSVERGSR